MRIEHRAKIYLIIFVFLLNACAADGDLGGSDLQSQNSPANHREGTIDEPIFKGKIFVSESGMQHQQTVVLVHGIGDNAARDWDALVPVLQQSFHVIRFDLPGFGRSSKQKTLYTPEKYALVLKYVIDSYAKKPVYLVGHSLGGAISLRYAAIYPKDIARLILVDVSGVLHKLAYSEYLSELALGRMPTFYRDQKRNLKNFTGNLLEKMHNLTSKGEDLFGDSNVNPSELEISSPSEIAAYGLMQENFGALLEKVRAPTLIIWGAKDTIASIRVAKTLATTIPDAALVVMDYAAHVPMKDAPLVFNRLVQQQLSADGPQLMKLQAQHRYGLVPKNSLNTKRVGRCDKQRRMIFEGEYARLEIRDCKDVVIRNAHVGEVVVSNSWVDIENSQILGQKYGLLVRRARITLTASRIQAENAIGVATSRLDIVGTTLIGKKFAVTAIREWEGKKIKPKTTIVVLSVSRAQSPQYRGVLHGSRRVKLEQPL